MNIFALGKVIFSLLAVSEINVVLGQIPSVDLYVPLVHLQEDYGGVMPPYFRFLTVMAFNVFLKEKVRYPYAD